MGYMRKRNDNKKAKRVWERNPNYSVERITVALAPWEHVDGRWEVFQKSDYSTLYKAMRKSAVRKLRHTAPDKLYRKCEYKRLYDLTMVG